RHVIPVTACSDGLGGLVTAGTSRPGTAGSDVYVVRTRPDGHRLWELTYDIAGVGGSDTGESITELRDGSGFATTGSTTLATTNPDVLLMTIRCDGGRVWATHSVSPATRESGLDVVEARSGNAGAGTAAGDLLVAGFTINPANGTTDGLLIRTRANGTLIWNPPYAPLPHTHVFPPLPQPR